MSPDFGPDEGVPADNLEGLGNERDLLVVIRLSNRQMGTHDERADIEMLANKLESAVCEAGIGEYDGDEFGGGECILFFCGPDEEALLGVIKPLLQRSPHGRGAHFVRLREGADGEMRREKIPL